MARREGLSAKQFAALRRRSVRYTKGDPETRGLYFRIPPTGPINFTVIVKKNRKQTWESVGTTDELSLDQAREKARAVIKRIKSGEPAPKPPQSVAAVAENWLARHVDKNNLHSADEYRRIVNTYIIPGIGHRDFIKLRRSEIVAFLDVIEDRHGAHQADAVLATLRAIAGWMQSRSDDYTPPFSRGMRRVAASQRARSRHLSDDELRLVWCRLSPAFAPARG
jgi:hypothetical protein